MKMKKVLSIVPALAMVLAITTACGGNSDSDAGNGGTSAITATGSSDSTSAVTGTDSGEGTPTITFMVPSFYGGELEQEGSDKVIEAYENYTGIHVDWRFVANDAYNDTFSMTLLDRSNIPMALVWQNAPNGTIVNAAKNDAFWDLTPFLESGDYPNLVQANENVSNVFNIDGKQIGIYRSRDIGRKGFTYRKDWAEAVGITEDPQTVEDVYNMLYAFTFEDPDGNGVNDTFGLETCGQYTGWIDVIQTWFGVGNEYVDVDGNLVPVFMTDEYKEALDWLRKLHEEGIIRSDWPTVQANDWGQAIQRGEAGCFVDTMDSARRGWDYFVNNNVMSVVDSTQYAAMQLVGPINGHSLPTDGHGGCILITRDGAKTEQDVKNVLTFLDKMCDAEMRTVADFGIEGISYDLDENGYIVRRDIEVANRPEQGLAQAVPAIPSRPEGMRTEAMTERTQAQYDAYAYTEPFCVFNPAASIKAASETYVSSGTVLDQLISDARIQYIAGAIDWDGFQAVVTQWQNQGGNQMIEELNELYHNS